MSRSSPPFLVFLLALALIIPVVGDVRPDHDPTPIDEGLQARIAEDPDARLDALVVLDRSPTPEDVARLTTLGLEVHRVFEPFRTLYVVGPGSAVERGAGYGPVAAVHANAELEQHGDTATRVIEARNLWDDMSTSSPAVVNGERLDGSGVGVAVVDSGIDATHPDLDQATVQNLRYLCTTPLLIETASGHDKCYGNWAAHGLVDGGPDNTCLDQAWTPVANTDTDSGHGTHVAGIVAGSGEASDGRFTGVAPGAALYGYGAGHVVSVLYALDAFAHILCIHDQVDPPIRVVSNSWGDGGGPYDANNAINVAADALVDEGLVVLFAAGNDGAGDENTVNSHARNPTPGVLSVASYDDEDKAHVQGNISSFSSRCLPSSQANDCPDVAAPGSGIVATLASTGPLAAALGHPLSGDGRYLCCAFSTTDYAPYYVGVSGTSMATPAVAGVVALMLQAEPTLAPADVEDILEDTAWAFDSASYTISDPSNPTSDVSPTAGHGLVNATAAVGDTRVLGTSSLGTDLPKLSLGPQVYTNAGPVGVDGQTVHGLQWTVPAGGTVTLSERGLVSGDPANAALAESTPCRFLVDGTAVPCQDGGTLRADGTGWRMDGDHVFTPGEHRVEAQLDLGGGWTSFDAWTVTGQ